MNLMQKIRTGMYATLLALAPAQMSCGDLLACENDYDCSGERVCRKVEDEETKEKIFQCVEPQQPQHLLAEPELHNACGDSLLTGKYLISVGCKGGTPGAFSEFPCRGSWEDAKNNFPLDYQGLTMLGKEILSRSTSPETAVITLRRDLAREDFGAFEDAFPDYASNTGENENPVEIRNRVQQQWEVDIERMQCYLSEEENTYFAEVNGKVETNPDLLLLLASAPWRGENLCRREQDTSWKEACNEEHPYPQD